MVDIGVVRTGGSYAFKYLTKVADYPEEVQRALYMKRRFSTSFQLFVPLVKQALPGIWIYLTSGEGCNIIEEKKWRSEDGSIFTNIQSGPS